MNKLKQSLLLVPIILVSGTVNAETMKEGAYLSLGLGVSKTQNWKEQTRLTTIFF